MPYITDVASSSRGITPSSARRERRDFRTDPACGIALAILLALPIWGALALTVRWLLRA